MSVATRIDRHSLQFVIPLNYGFHKMNELLTRIENEYVASVSRLLTTASFDPKLYAAFLPFFGWDAYPEDHAEHGSSIYLLDTQILESAGARSENDADVGRYAYFWGEFCDKEPERIPSSTLQPSLLEWYTYQNENDEAVGEAQLLQQIGSVLSSVCHRLNETEFPSSSLTDDFVVFTSCMADEECEFGFTTSVPEKWLAKKRATGMFIEW